MKKDEKETNAEKGAREYGAKAIKVLEGLEAVRKRPAMYIGSTNVSGLHHLVYEVVDNSVDEALAGYCNNIKVILHSNGSCSVEDDGRGIPVDIHPTEKVSAAQVVMTKLHAGGKFEKESYKYSGGLHGVGVSVVNALSEKLELKIYRNGKIYSQKYEYGKPLDELKEIGETEKNGTYIRFTPDSKIFEVTEFNFDTLASRLREMAFLNKGLKIEIRDENTEQEEVFFFEGGIASFIEAINAKKNPVFNEIVQFQKDDGQYILDLAFQYNDGYADQVFSFVNNIRTTEGGTHEAGFRSALTKSCNKAAQNLNMLKDGENLSSDDVREGLVCVLSIKVPEPQFEGQTKSKLGNNEVKGLVDSWVYAFLNTYYEEHPQITKKILQKAFLAQQARNAAKRARELTRRKTVLENSVLPGKLADCSESDASKTELFIVEGDSAGGCFSGDTKVALLDGRNLSFKDLIEEDKKGIKNYCYTTTKNGCVDIAPIKNPRKTKINTSVIKIILDNDEEIVCTPNHLFMLKDSSYKKAQDLTFNDSLMPLYRKLSKIENKMEINSYATQHYNHKIKKIIKLDKKIDVYDLEIEETHNFALASGIFVHNSAKQGRDRFIQAILPLRGKVINAEKARFDKLLANNEIKDLVTAIGAGIGEEEFDPTKARYHKIVIMTDADVDGSHIRILLLTFFFRHMKPLIESGYLYVAQPPLYKAKVGKTSKYLKDDSELKQFLFDWAEQNTSLKLDDKTYKENEFKNLLDQILQYDKEVTKISNYTEVSKQHCHELINFMDKHDWTLGKYTQNEIIKKLQEHFKNYKIKCKFKTDQEDENALETENQVKEILIFTENKKTWEVPLSFFESEESEKLITLYKPIAQIDLQKWNFVISDKNEITGNGVLRLADTIVNSGKSLMTIQRYKGLGEMNPDQLWETTMDPETRCLLKVTIEDGIKADQWFTSLMGDVVEDRREYIEKHAHFVRNLDI
ncbi:MAG: DNA topoisomerase (ATP-hydrolyzing) subunit B [bacterium]